MSMIPLTHINVESRTNWGPRRVTVSQLNSLERVRVGCYNCSRSGITCAKSGNPYEPCASCKLLPQFLWSSFDATAVQPCIRVSFSDLRLHRRGPTVNKRLAQWLQGTRYSLKAKGGLLVPDRIPPPVPGGPPLAATHLFLTQGIGKHAMHVPSTRYEPMPADEYITSYHWTDSTGAFRSMHVPPYFITEQHIVCQNIRDFCEESREAYIQALIGDKESGGLVARTFQLALVVATVGQNKLVKNALDIWLAARLIEKPWRVVAGGVAIGLNAVTEPGHPFDGFTPIPPVMAAELDLLIIRDILKRPAEQLLRQLKTVMGERKNETWLEIYLTLFILMHHIGLTVKNMKATATWKGLKAGNRHGNLTQGFIHTCKVLLSHFHFVFAGSVPIGVLVWNSPVIPGVLTTPEQTEYLREVRTEMSRKNTRLTRWWELSMYDDEMY